MYLYDKLKNPGPWHIFIGLTVGVWLLAAYRPDQLAAAHWILAVGAALALLNPRNGLFLTILAAPLALGEPQDPFIWLIDGLAGVTVLAWLLRLAVTRRRPQIPYLWLILLLAGLSLANLPLNLKELMTALRVLDAPQIWHLLVEGRKFHDLFALRSLVVFLGGLGFLACCLDQLRREDLRPLGLGLGLIALVLTVFSLAWWLGWLPRSHFYLSLNLTGISHRHGEVLLASTAFNRQYFNEMLIIPLAVAGGITIWGKWPARAAAGLALALMLTAMTVTGQRSPFLCLGGMVVAAALMMVWVRGRQAFKPALIGLAAGVGLLAAVIALDYYFGGGHLANRFLGLGSDKAVAGIGSRPQIWTVAGSMFAAFPLTGAGLGTFRILAHEFVERAGLNWTPDLIGVLGTAHNTYFQWAAELGLIIGGSALLLGWLLARNGLLALQVGKLKTEAAVMLTALVGLAVFGVFQHITYLSGMAVLILALVAGLAKLRPDDAPPPAQPSASLILTVGLSLAVVIGGLKLATISQWPFRDNWRAGFSYGELQLEDNREAWWSTGRRSAIRSGFFKPVQTKVRLPHPLVKQRPQTLVFKIDGREAGRITLTDTDWQTVRLELDRYPHDRSLLTIKADYAFCPFREGGSLDRRWLSFQMKDIRNAPRSRSNDKQQ